MSKRFLPKNDSDMSESSSEDEAGALAAPPAPLQVTRAPGGGKQLRMQVESSSDSDSSDDEQHYVRPGTGKQLRPMPAAPSVGGKSLRMNLNDSDYSDDSEEEVAVAPPPAPPQHVITAGRGGGKQLRVPIQSDSSDDDEQQEAEVVEEEEEEEEFVPAPTRGRRGGQKQQQQQRKQEILDSSDDDASYMDIDSSSDEEEMLEDTYDADKLYLDDEDRERLENMPEVEREAILAERFEKRRSEQEMRKALREAKKLEREEKRKNQKQKKTPSRSTAAATKRGKAKKAPAAATTTTTSAATTRSERNRDVAGKKAKKDAALASLREDRAVQKEATAAVVESEDELDYGSSEDSDEDYDGEDQAGKQRWGKQKTSKTAAVVSSSKSRLASMKENDSDEDSDIQGGVKGGEIDYEEAGLDQFKKITLTRKTLRKWCTEPYFEKAVVGCFVKLGIGADQNTGKSCYRLCEIVGIEVGKKDYLIPTSKPSREDIKNTAGKNRNKDEKVLTKLLLRLKFGSNVKAFRMITISDKPPTDDDVRRYTDYAKATHKLAGIHRIISKKQARRLARSVNKLVNDYVYTNEDIEVSMKQQQNKKLKRENIAARKTKADMRVKITEQAFEEAKTNLLKAERDDDPDEDDYHLEKLKDAVVDAENEMNKAIDQRNQIHARDEARSKALKESKMSEWDHFNRLAKAMNQKSDFESYKHLSQEAEDSKGYNPFARRKVKPQVLWEVGNAAATTEEGGGDTTKTNGDFNTTSPKPEVIKTVTQDSESNGDSANNNSTMVENSNGAEEVVIDEEAWRSSTSKTADVLMKSIRKREGISLEEYQERKKLGSL